MQPEHDLHIERPAVYLDQWVWLRLARAAMDQPRAPSDRDVLAAVRRASDAGVAFPLSGTHYQELTTSMGNNQQRTNVAETMASISHCRTLRSPRILLRHQMLVAMHQRFGRPAFRPPAPGVLGIGAQWAITGTQQMLSLVPRDGGASALDVAAVPGLAEFVRRANQAAELELLIGARDDTIAELREHGYRPEAHRAVLETRLAWETTYVDILERDHVSRAELRVRVQARELIHEHLDLLSDLLQEYHLDLSRALHADPHVPGSGRSQIVAFVDAVPSLRISVDLKVELFPDTHQTWDVNSLYDIDALSVAVPYCHVVVADNQMRNLLARSHAGERNNTVIATLGELPDHLDPLVARARSLGGDVSGWDWAGPGQGWDPLRLENMLGTRADRE